MDFFKIQDDYIEFLRQYDPRVAENKHSSRPYVGIVLTIGEIEYYAPFTSPKEKHRHMRNSIDFRKISGGLLGAINFNNMIPVPECALIRLVITDEPDTNYRRLLQNQYRAIQDDWDHIQHTAERLRNVLISEQNLSTFQQRLKTRCCDLLLLESIYTQYPAS